MKHKYPIGTWVRFYRNAALIIAVVQYHKTKEPHETSPTYYTDFGPVEEEQIIEHRKP